MKFTFRTAFRSYLLVLAAMLVWSVWHSSAQIPGLLTVTNQPAGTNAVAATPPPMATPDWVDHLAASFPFLEYTFWGNEVWKYLFSLIYIFLAFYFSKLVDFATRVWLKKLTDKTETPFDDLLLGLLNGPVKIVVFVIFLRIGLDVFQWPAMVQKIVSKGFTLVVAVSLIYMTMKFVDLLIDYWRLRTHSTGDKDFDRQLFPIIRKSLKLFVIVVGILVTLDNLNVNITAALASLSIGGLAVGLAAQDTLANLFGGIAVYADKPFYIGDAIQVDAFSGNVESIGLRSTRLRNGNGDLITIPNKMMGNVSITNTSRRSNIRTEMNLALAGATPVDKVRRALALLDEVYRSHPQTADLTVNFNKFADSSLNIVFAHVWKGTDGNAQQKAMQELNLKLKERLDAEGISFAPPAQLHYLRQDSDWRMQATASRPANT